MANIPSLSFILIEHFTGLASAEEQDSSIPVRVVCIIGSLVVHSAQYVLIVAPSTGDMVRATQAGKKTFHKA